MSDVEKDVLCRGLKFGIPPNERKETIAAEFEQAWLQLPRAGIAKYVELQCKAEMTSLAHRYSNSKIDYSGYRLNRQHISAIENLKNKNEIIITKPDKSNGVVLLTKDDYIRKMRTILEDTSKFVHLGDADTKDRTTQQERALQAFLLRARKKGDISHDVYDQKRLSRSTKPRIYGLPKLHKEGVPLRPILLMINSPLNELAKWLTEVLAPVSQKYSQHQVKDSFEFFEHVDKFAELQDCSSVHCARSTW